MRIIEQVCLALEAAHSEGVVHRDLKPQNIMLDKQGRAAVMDFGIARSIESGGMTQTGMLVGTPEYMSPEQVMGEHVDVRSDLFTLGVILYELLTGSTPYKSDTAQSAMFKRTRELPKPPIEVDSTIPRLLSDITVKCLQIDPALRYQSAREILADLEAWRGGATRSDASVVARRPRHVFSSAQKVDPCGSCRSVGSARRLAGSCEGGSFRLHLRSKFHRAPPSRLRFCLFATHRETKRLTGWARALRRRSAPTSGSRPICASFHPNASARSLETCDWRPIPHSIHLRSSGWPT